MANIQVQKDEAKKEQQMIPARDTRWDPFRMLRDLAAWDPFREIQPLMPAMPAGFTPSFEVKETKDGFSFKADVPGVKEGDIDVTLSGNRLTITGKREAEREEKSDQFYCYERSYGDFSRAFTLPDGIDASKVNAELKDGVLTVSVAKSAQTQAKKIAIQSPQKKS
jgi:HSP20 family protein